MEKYQLLLLKRKKKLNHKLNQLLLQENKIPHLNPLDNNRNLPNNNNNNNNNNQKEVVLIPKNM